MKVGSGSGYTPSRSATLDIREAFSLLGYFSGEFDPLAVWTAKESITLPLYHARCRDISTIKICRLAPYWAHNGYQGRIRGVGAQKATNPPPPRICVGKWVKIW